MLTTERQKYTSIEENKNCVPIVYIQSKEVRIAQQKEEMNLKKNQLR